MPGNPLGLSPFDTASILRRFWADPGSILRLSWVDSGSLVGRWCVTGKLIPSRLHQTASTGRSNQVASLWAAIPKSTKNHAKSGLGAKLKSSKTDEFGYQIQLLTPESDPAWLETPWVLFLAPTQVAQPLGRWYRSLFTRSGCRASQG